MALLYEECVRMYFPKSNIRLRFSKIVAEPPGKGDSRLNIGTLDSLLPAVNFASRATEKPGTSWGIRIIPDCQIFYVLSGRAELRVGRRKYDVRAGDCAYYGPECATLLSVVEPIDFFSIHFEWNRLSPQPEHPGHRIRHMGNDELVGELTTHLLSAPPYGEVPIPVILSVSGLEPLFMKLVKEYEMERPGYAIALRGLFMQAVTLMARQLLDNLLSSQSPGRIDRAIEAMREQPERNWSVAELAGLCGYHPIHFAKLFKEDIGLLPKHYIIGERIKQAKRALLQGEKVEVISKRLGFTSIHYFSHQFKRVTGLTPTEYRLQGREQR
jgi:AraC-like DNA-binding protein